VVLCRLCRQLPAIKNSHALPAFVFRALKTDSPTGFFRNPNNPNLRRQDGDKHELLCEECEGRFGKSEHRFDVHIFDEFHKHDRDHFAYGPWLHYFMTTLAWRILVLDLPGFAADSTIPKSLLSQLADIEVTMRNYLLGSTHLAGCLRNHAVAWTVGHIASAELAASGPNVAIRRSVFGYTVLDRRNGQSAVLHNLAGFMCFLIVKGNPLDKWSGTKINSAGGRIRQPQKVSSSFMGELLGCVVESSRNHSRISALQQQKVAHAMAKNPNAASLRFQHLDEQVEYNPNWNP
jgi:hypothetical protein